MNDFSAVIFVSDLSSFAYPNLKKHVFYQASRAFFVSGQAQQALHGGFFSTTGLGLLSSEHAPPSSPHAGLLAGLGLSILLDDEAPIIT